MSENHKMGNKKLAWINVTNFATHHQLENLVCLEQLILFILTIPHAKVCWTNFDTDLAVMSRSWQTYILHIPVATGRTSILLSVIIGLWPNFPSSFAAPPCVAIWLWHFKTSLPSSCTCNKTSISSSNITCKSIGLGLFILNRQVKVPSYTNL